MSLPPHSGADWGTSNKSACADLSKVCRHDLHLLRDPITRCGLDPLGGDDAPIVIGKESAAAETGCHYARQTRQRTPERIERHFRANAETMQQALPVAT